MKKIVFLLATLILLSGVRVNSQVASVINYSSLEKKLDKSNNNIEHAKRSTKVKTWTDHAELLVDAFNVHNDVLYIGMGTSEAVLFLQNPREIQTSQEGPNQIEEYVYDRVTLKFINGELANWTETNPIVDNALTKARDAINRAIELNTNGKENSRIANAVSTLQSAYEIKAVLDYDKGDTESSYRSFAEILNLGKLPVMDQNAVDSVIMYNAGRTALESENYSDAVKYFTELTALDYSDPFLYVYLEQSLLATGDTAKAVSTIQEGFSKYPENQAIMNEMINYYINTQQPDEALKLLSVAKQRDPENVSYYFAEAVMQENLGNIDEAEKVYLECLEMEPDFFNAAYNIGVLYYNKAVKLYEEASLTTDNAEFQRLDTEGDAMLKKAVPYMERASEIDPTDSYVLENLRNVYYRLEMTDKYNEVVEKLKNM
ncbi:MAG: tetratricopeptide repeat protein [Bacteroidales bacterium]|nr:tetratricopeptide repeat protein [Bacteroidales bacterium]